MFASCTPPGSQACARVSGPCVSCPVWLHCPRPGLCRAQGKVQGQCCYRRWLIQATGNKGPRAGHKTIFRIFSKSQLHVFSHKTKERNTWCLLSKLALVLKINQWVSWDSVCSHFRPWEQALDSEATWGGSQGQREEAATPAPASASWNQSFRRGGSPVLQPQDQGGLPARLGPPTQLQLSGDSCDSCDQTGQMVMSYNSRLISTIYF